MTEPRCGLTELPVSGCSHCDTDIDPGDGIRADGEGGYLGECCGEDEDG